MKTESLQDENPDRLRTRAMKKNLQLKDRLPDIDIFEKVPGIDYFDPREWSSFPYQAGKGRI